MHGRIAREVPTPPDWLLPDVYLTESAQLMAQEGVARSRDFYRAGASAAQAGGRLCIEVAETAWGSAKLLNDKVVQNAARNTDAVFEAAEAVARAGSLPEIMTLQGEFLRQLLAQTSEQAKEFVDLSTRAAQHVLETMQGAAVRLMRTDF